MIKMVLPAICAVSFFLQSRAQLISSVPTNFDLSTASIAVDQHDFILIQKAAILLQQDIQAVTGKKIPIHNSENKIIKNTIIIGSITHSSFIKSLTGNNKISVGGIKTRWEAFQIKTVDGNLIIAGSDRGELRMGYLNCQNKSGFHPGTGGPMFL